MMMFCSKFQEKPYKTLTRIFSQFSNKLKTTLKSGLTMKLFGLLTPKRFMINWEMILTSGKLY